MAVLATATPGGFLLVLAILLPVAGIILCFVTGGRHADRIALGLTPFGLALAIAIAIRVAHSGKTVVYTIGGLPPPLGIALRADGISAVMLVAAAVIITAAAFYAREKFATRDDVRESRSAISFWIMLQAIWAALIIIFVGADLFNLYVALELLTFAAVPSFASTGDRRRLPLPCVICFSPCSVRFRICLALPCFTAPAEHWTFRFLHKEFGRRLWCGPRPP